MTETDARYSVDLLNALSDLPDVRKGLAHATRETVLEFGAFEGDHDGGTGRGSAFIPRIVATQIIDFAEKLIRKELRRLRVTPDGEPAVPSQQSSAGTQGGKARAAALSPERRKEIAKAASNARWGNRAETS